MVGVQLRGTGTPRWLLAILRDHPSHSLAGKRGDVGAVGSGGHREDANDFLLGEWEGVPVGWDAWRKRPTFSPRNEGVAFLLVRKLFLLIQWERGGKLRAFDHR